MVVEVPYRSVGRRRYDHADVGQFVVSAAVAVGVVGIVPEDEITGGGVQDRVQEVLALERLVDPSYSVAGMPVEAVGQVD